MAEPIFQVEDLRIAVFDEAAAYRKEDHGLTARPGGKPLGPGWIDAVPGISFSVAPGEVLALVGESGGGKTLTLLGSLGLLSPGAKVIGGSVTLLGHRVDLYASLEERGRKNTWRERRKEKKRQKAYMGESLDKEWRRLMGNEVGMLFQDPVSSWDPAEVVGTQAGEVLREHSDLSEDEIAQRVLDALGEVNLPAVGKYLSFRHELSRGEAQRAMLAAALIKGPSLLMADEPLSGLDAPVASAILELIKDMQRKRGLGMVFVTHDLATVASIADRVAVIYGGQIVEEGPLDSIYYSPQHPYTDGLLGSIPWPGATRLRPIDGSPPRIVEVARHRCSFADRCRYQETACLDGQPPLAPIAYSHVACVRAAQLDLPGVGDKRP
ncbi:MAG TPA: ABC transporter ATP-binding protein [Acidimicrobiia bacterium]|jgi:oligopeptide/dipeptide ABC transporter ATP-binding protein|nr:ABC transporter ATP-binding protein [Acidimicrobiia bacterium]